MSDILIEEPIFHMPSRGRQLFAACSEIRLPRSAAVCSPYLSFSRPSRL